MDGTLRFFHIFLPSPPPKGGAHPALFSSFDYSSSWFLAPLLAGHLFSGMVNGIRLRKDDLRNRNECVAIL